MAGGSEWAKYTPRQRAKRAKAQSKRCRKMNLARSKEMRTRIAREMGKANKGRKHSPEVTAKKLAWKDDPVKYKAYREKQRRIVKEQYRTNKELTEKRNAGGRENLKNYRKDKVSEDDWWARNFKVSRHKLRLVETEKKLNTIGLSLPSQQNVSEAYLDEVDEFLAEVL